MKHSIWILVLILVASLGVSCTSGGGGTPASTAVIRGTVLDSLDEPLSGAAVQCQDLSSTQTSTDGAFELATGIGPKKLTISKDGVVIAEQCLTVAELVTYELGTITPSSPTNCDTVCTNSADSADPDCDGLSADIETAGWDVVITLGDGTTETRHVSSDPALKDTDGDGLSDAEEFAARTDPTRADTDGDMLSDYAELKVYKSNPLMADTDGDSTGPNGDKPSDPNLWDGYEVLVSHTSPVLADTDGDGKTDWEEVHSGGTSPLIADLPVLALEVYGDPLLALKNGSVTSGCTSSNTRLEREAQEHVNTDNVSTKMSIENTVNIHTEAEAGTGTWPPSFNAKITTDTEFKQGYIHETTANFTQTSVQDMQNLASCWETYNLDFSNGQLSVALKLRNQSGLSFKVKDLSVIAYQVTTGSNFRLIGTLTVDSAQFGSGIVMGPFGDITMTFAKTDIDALTMKSLTENPSAIMFEVGAYSLFQLDDWGVSETVNFAKLGESVVQRTGLLTIDYGDGTVERHMIATNVRRNADGTAAGITIKEALTNVLKIPYETETQKDSGGEVIGKKVLKKIKTTATFQNDSNQQGRGFWIVGGNSDAFAAGITTNFDDIVLKNGERVSLVFLRDTDLDGLFDNEERLLGTNINAQDTDGDGLTDYEEAKVGWDVSVSGKATYHVYSDPRFADVDGDFLSDSAEMVLGTDPYKKNTDGDSLDDTNDPYPLSAPCLNGGLLGIAAWWNGTMANATTVSDMSHTVGTGDPLGYASNGVLSGSVLSITWKPDYITTAGMNTVFNLNPLLTQKDQQITVADDAALDPRRSISPQSQFTLAGWVYWNGVATGAPWATIFTKGTPGVETYGLYIRADGALGLSLYRQVHEKSWVGSCDSCCSDNDYAIREFFETPSYRLPHQAWVHIAATFGNETVRIYVNGVSQGEWTLNYTWDCAGSCWCRRDTQYLIINNSPLRIGLDLAPASALWSFRGMMDELQIFGRQMSPTEMTLFHQIGVCGP